MALAALGSGLVAAGTYQQKNDSEPYTIVLSKDSTDDEYSKTIPIKTKSEGIIELPENEIVLVKKEKKNKLLFMNNGKVKEGKIDENNYTNSSKDEIGEEFEWVKIRVKNMEGYAAKKYLKEPEKEKIQTNSNSSSQSVTISEDTMTIKTNNGGKISGLDYSTINEEKWFVIIMVDYPKLLIMGIMERIVLKILLEIKNNTYFYMIKSFRNEKGKNTTKIIECLGKLDEVTEKANGEDTYVWAKKYVAQKTKDENENKGTYFEKLVEGEELDSEQKLFNLGNIFLRKIFDELELTKLCKEIKKKYKFEYELSDILEDLICTRIMYPNSKYSSYEDSKKFLRQPKYELYDVYRALDIISKEKENIEKWCYEKSLKIIKNRNTKILYYDCTNYFFELELEDEDNLETGKKGLRKYGKNK